MRRLAWLDPNPDLGYRNNTFAQYSTMPSGKPVKLRADDGIHMTDQGANFLFPSIRLWLAQTAVVNPPAFTPTRTGDARSAAIDTPRAVEGSLNRTNVAVARHATGC